MSELTDKVVEKGKKGMNDAWTFLVGTSPEIRKQQVNDAIYFGILGAEGLAAAGFGLKFLVPIIYNVPQIAEFDPVLAVPSFDFAVRCGNALVDVVNLSIRPYSYNRFDFIGTVGTVRRVKHKYFPKG